MSKPNLSFNDEIRKYLRHLSRRDYIEQHTEEDKTFPGSVRLHFMSNKYKKDSVSKDGRNLSFVDTIITDLHEVSYLNNYRNFI